MKVHIKHVLRQPPPQRLKNSKSTRKPIYTEYDGLLGSNCRADSEQVEDCQCRAALVYADRVSHIRHPTRSEPLTLLSVEALHMFAVARYSTCGGTVSLAQRPTSNNQMLWCQHTPDRYLDTQLDIEMSRMSFFSWGPCAPCAACLLLSRSAWAGGRTSSPQGSPCRRRACPARRHPAPPSPRSRSPQMRRRSLPAPPGMPPAGDPQPSVSSQPNHRRRQLRSGSPSNCLHRDMCVRVCMCGCVCAYVCVSEGGLGGGGGIWVALQRWSESACPPRCLGGVPGRAGPGYLHRQCLLEHASSGQGR